MYGVTSTFLATVVRPHQARTRVRVLSGPVAQFGLDPAGTDLPILDGEVKFTASSDVKATADLTVPGDYWPAVLPYGAELFIERGVVYPGGSEELVPLGYFRIEEASQADAPRGAIRLSCMDRVAQLRQNRVLRPWQIPDGTSHRTVFEALVNGGAGGAALAAFYGVTVPITWSEYDPDAAEVYGGLVVEDSTYDVLAQLAALRGCVLRFDESGGLGVGPRDAATLTPVWTATAGEGGNLVRASRSVSRERIYNVVVAYGTNPAAPTSYVRADNTSASSPIRRTGPFGPSLRFYGSPVIRTDAGAASAAQTVLSRYAALPESAGFDVVPNPALRPLDVMAARLDRHVQRWVIDEVSVPLGGGRAMALATRTIGAPPPDDGQRPGAGVGTEPWSSGTLTAFDESTGENRVDVGDGVTYDNLPVTGCCGGTIGQQVALAWTSGGPMIMGPLSTYPSRDLNPGFFNPTYATPTVREVVHGTSPTIGPAAELSLTTGAGTQVGDLLVLVAGVSFCSGSDNLDGLNLGGGAVGGIPLPLPGGTAGTWTPRTAVQPANLGGADGVGGGYLAVWTRPVGTGGAQTVTLTSDGGSPSAVFGACYVLSGSGLTVVDADNAYTDQDYGGPVPHSPDAPAPSVTGVTGGLLICGWQSEAQPLNAQPNPPTVPGSMSGQVDAYYPSEGRFASAREALALPGATGVRTATFTGGNVVFGAAAIVVRGAQL